MCLHTHTRTRAHTHRVLSGGRTRWPVSPALLVSEILPGKKDVEKLRCHKVLEHRCTAVCVSMSILLFFCELKYVF